MPMKGVRALGVLGLVLLLAGLVFVFMANALWWIFLTLGGPLFLGAINYILRENALLMQAETNKRALIEVYGVYVLAGLVVETVRIAPHLWRYNGIYNHTVSVILLILIGYPLFLAFIFETFVLVRHVIHRTWLAAGLTALIFVLWNEVPNNVAPVWVITAPSVVLVSTLFVVGYIFEVLVAVGANRYLTQTEN